MSIRHDRVFETTSTKAIVMVVLFTMTIMRLVWLEVRDYPADSTLKGSISVKTAMAGQRENCKIQSYEQFASIEKASPSDLLHAWLASPAYVAAVSNSCSGGYLEIERLIDINKICTILAAVMMVFLTRFLTSSWVLAVAIGAALLSRGEMLVKHGLIAHDSLVMMLLSGWFAFAAHFLKTAARFSLLGMLLCYFFASLFDKAILSLGVVMPIFCILAFVFRKKLKASLISRKSRVRKNSSIGVASLDVLEAAILKTEHFWVKTMNHFSKQIKHLPSFDPSVAYMRGSVFQTLSIPFCLWIMQRKRWLKMTLGWGASFVIFVSVVSQFESALFDLSHNLNLLDVTLENWHSLKLLSGVPFLVWLNHILDSIDFYYALSASVILACLITPPHPSLVALIESVWLLVISFVVLGLVGYLVDSWDLTLFNRLNLEADIEGIMYNIPVSNFVFWFEPVILTLGIIGVYYLAKSVYLNEGGSK